MEIENKEAFSSALLNEINLFIGAGFCVLAKNQNEEFLPTGGELSQDIIEKFDMGDVGNLNLGQICTIISRNNRLELNEYLIDKFTVANYDERYTALENRLNISHIFSTNIDNLIHKIFGKSNH